MVTLEREEITVEDFTYEDLYEKVSSRLGYSVLGKAKINNDRKNEISKVFQKLDIKPFKKELVEKYKNKMEVGYRNLFISGVVLSVLSGLVSIMLGMFYGNAWFLVGLVLSIIVGNICGNFISYNKEWEKIVINNFTSPIPEFALQTALDINTELPYCIIYIDSLFQKAKPLDPFLVVKYGDEDYYLEVWNEPKFNQKREV